MTPRPADSIRTTNPIPLQRAQWLEEMRRRRGRARRLFETAVSRRGMLRSAGAAAGLLAAGHWMRGQAAVPGDTPKPIPGGFMQPPLTELFHNFAPGVFDPLDTDRSGIFDFNGHIGYGVIAGSGTGVNTITKVRSRLGFVCDIRFMQ